MIIQDGLFTSESVSEGHPDKIADQISDAILDAFLEKDPRSRVACEVLAAPGLIVAAGEVNTQCYVDIAGKVKEVLKAVGYNHSKKGLDYKSCSVLTSINHQSPDIERAVGFGKNQGAGDQGLMFGYAVDESPEWMPLAPLLAHRLMKNFARLRKSSGYDFLWPDGKSQVTVEYEEGKIKRIPTVVVSVQHSPEMTLAKLKECVVEELIKKTIPKVYLQNTDFVVNPGGAFTVGGPQSDCGLTGRKIIVDSYGGYGSHGGGSFSGKDPSKVDRSGAYIARHIAKSLAAAGLKKCLVQLAYAIGKPQPVSISIQDYGSSRFSQKELSQIVSQNWDLSPHGIIQELDLLKPFYQKTSVYGHFGREDEGFAWEKLKALKL